MKLLPQRAKSLLDKERDEAISVVLSAIIEISHLIAIFRGHVNFDKQEPINSTSTYDIKIKYVFV